MEGTKARLGRGDAEIKMGRLTRKEKVLQRRSGIYSDFTEPSANSSAMSDKNANAGPPPYRTDGDIKEGKWL